jgi:hypothetical protein
MRIDRQRGFLRTWAVLAVAWVGLMGWSEYADMPWKTESPAEAECWDRLAKWPDGKPFDIWDAISNDTPDGSSEKDRWRAMIRQKVEGCTAAAPIMQRLPFTTEHTWSILKASLAIVLLPPLALLIAGGILGWVVKGFRANA